MKSDDNGETWSKPILTVHSDTEKMTRNTDIQLWIDPDNTLWVMWSKSPYHEGDRPATIRTPFELTYFQELTGVEGVICRDPDADTLVWEDSRDICDGFIRNKPIVLKSGQYLFPAYDWTHPDRYYLRFSDNKGKTFRNVPASEKIGRRAFDETMVYERSNGLRMLVRTNLTCIAYSDSPDGGITWTETKPYQPAPSARFYIGWLRCGLLCMVRDVGTETQKVGMKICLSDDEGETWKWELVLDARRAVSYPDLCEDHDGNIYIIYDRERDNRTKLNRESWTSEAAKEILLSRVTVHDIQTGFLGEGSYLSRVISRAMIDTVLM